MQQHRSHILADERQVWVYTPPGYISEGRPYPLLLLLDAAYTNWIPVPTILDNLLAAGRIPPLVGVIVESRDRWRELGFYQPYVEFLAQVLIPWVRDNFHAGTDPAETILGGFSRAGVMAAYVALCHPGVFGSVLSQSGSFQNASEYDSIDSEQEWLTRQIVAREKVPVRFYLEAGLLENERDRPHISLLRANRHARDVLRAKGYEVHYREFSGDHSYLNWRGTLSNGLLALIGSE